jgi:hypothetical protein
MGAHFRTRCGNVGACGNPFDAAIEMRSCPKLV